MRFMRYLLMCLPLLIAWPKWSISYASGERLRIGVEKIFPQKNDYGLGLSQLYASWMSTPFQHKACLGGVLCVEPQKAKESLSKIFQITNHPKIFS